MNPPDASHAPVVEVVSSLKRIGRRRRCVAPVYQYRYLGQAKELDDFAAYVHAHVTRATA